MTDQPDVSLAPGCFGSPIIFEAEHPVCSACMFAAQCRPKAAARREVLHEHFGIVPKIVTPKAPAPAPEPRQQVGGALVSRKALDLLDAKERQGIHIKEALIAGKNPIAQTARQAWLRLACSLLIQMDGSMRKRDLIFAFTTHLHEDRESAVAHANQAVQLFTAAGALVELNGAFSIKRDQ